VSTADLLLLGVGLLGGMLVGGGIYAVSYWIGRHDRRD
jgi:hypothetical protein